MRTLHFSFIFFTFTFQILSLIHLIFVSGQCLSDQKSKLLQLKDSLQFDSFSSTKLVYWNSSTDCCRWNGVSCDASSGFVTSLELDNESIFNATNNWKILFTLKNLEKLNLAFNSFYQKIPDEFRNLENLKILNLSSAGFFGQVPLAVSKLEKLVILDLSTHLALGVESLKLENPDLKTLVQNLTRLQELHLHNVNISAQGNDWCNALSHLSNLIVLSLVNCHLLGPISSSLLNPTSLSIIQLDINNFSTVVPDFFADFSNLTFLSLNSCNLRGKFPEKIFQLPKLKYMDLSYNDLNGSIPSFGSSNSLAYVDLSKNNLQGSISSNYFEGLTSLAFLNLNYNNLSGTIPPSLFALPSLQNLILSNNRFDGQLLEFPNASSSLLSSLDLTSNHLEGPIPNSVYKLERLNKLSLSLNHFNGTVKLNSFKSFGNLTILELSHNNLSIDDATSDTETYSSLPQFKTLGLASCNLKRFPHYLKNQTELAYLDLSANHLAGELPHWIWKVGTYLYYMNLSCNLLSNLEENYTYPRHLAVLDLHANLFQGIIPIPPKSAIYVDYSSNNFNASFPENVGNFPALLFLVSNNKITGEIPQWICNATNLRLLDLSNNVLSGSIPSCLLRLYFLDVLKLRKNKLTGTIPDAFPPKCKLQTLDLSGNTLEGKIPSSLSNCLRLHVLNIKNNKIEDGFPCTLIKASDMHVLILRSNRFFGDLLNCSWEKQSWKSLQIMDIADNNFKGILPLGMFSYWSGQMLGDHFNGETPNKSKYLSFDVSGILSESFYNVVELTIKGLDLELVKILKNYAYIDLSCNKFHGPIPDAVGRLKEVYILNFSHNAFTGSIPSSIGNLIQLGSLDLSTNQLTGAIPHALANLTFLSLLNLSYNQLTGKIPSGFQFQTFSDNSFWGNTGLCGFQLNISCEYKKVNEMLKEAQIKKKEIDWEYISAGIGFVLGLVITCWLICFCPCCSSLVDQVIKRMLHEKMKTRVSRNPIRSL
ncbi:hypothetical protein M9H77_28237 [Catharanthus roseus]|uniref:Uncharacterized protein n=1 Tax=Catharanthus roseus TaxID=4058 RepID=A0ACC0AH10_CATRO|nr:hypothetical protein M9H77_28237 [Catharanthus roseus]